jgi:hypothetical protein
MLNTSSFWTHFRKKGKNGKAPKEKVAYIAPLLK